MRRNILPIGDEQGSARRLLRRLIVASLLVVHVGLVFGNLRWNFITFDEVAHVPAGLSHWETGTFALGRVNPPLARTVATLPLLFASPRTDYHQLSDRQADRLERKVGVDFIAANGPRSFDLIRLARLAGIVWSLLGGVAVYLWARNLYAGAGGTLALVLWCFDPNVLAFAAVATADLPATVAGLWATYAFQAYLHARRWETAVVAGAALGVALLTKYTLLLLLGILPVMWFLDRSREPGPGRSRTLRDSFLVIFTSVVILNAGYGWRHTGWALKDYIFVSRVLTGHTIDASSPPETWGVRNRFRDSWLGELITPLPADYLGGIDIQRFDFERRLESYLNGQWRDHGWWYYYLEAFAIKEPLGFLLLMVWALGLALSRRAGVAYRSDELSLAFAALAYLVVVSSQTGINVHMRYVLPMWPYLIIVTGKLARYLRPGNYRQGAAVAALALWGAVSSLSIYPHSLSYFNEVAGGPTGGHACLVDSNIDWGQDLIRLRDWLDRHPECRPLHLAYFNDLDPALFGIEYSLPPPGSPESHAAGEAADSARWGPQPGYYAISVNFLRGMIFEAPNGRGGWDLVPRHDTYSYFRQFKPIARAGYSIYIYRLTKDAANAARRRMGLPPLNGVKTEEAPHEGSRAER